MLASVIRDVIAPIVRECPEECGIVSISEIEVSSEFSYATVYISALQEPEVALAFFDRKKSALQRSLSSLYRKRIPELRFRIDDRGEKGERIEELLEK